MKNHELFSMLESMKTLAGLEGVKFLYAKNRNIDKLKRESARVQATSAPTPEFEPFQTAHQALIQEMAKGQPRVAEEDMPAFKEAFEGLKKQHREIVEAREKQLTEYNAYLNEEVADDFKFYMLKLDDVPAKITDAQMAVIMPFIEEEE